MTGLLLYTYTCTHTQSHVHTQMRERENLYRKEMGLLRKLSDKNGGIFCINPTTNKTWVDISFMTLTYKYIKLVLFFLRKFTFALL